MAAFRFDARAYARFQSVTHSNERIRNRNARVTSIIHRHHNIRPRSIRPSVSFVVRRSWNTRSFENINPSSAVRAPLETRAPTLLLATLRTRRHDDTTRTNRGINRKTYHARAKSSTDARRFASLQTRRQVKAGGWARPSKTQIVVWFYLYVQTVMVIYSTNVDARSAPTDAASVAWVVRSFAMSKSSSSSSFSSIGDDRTRGCGRDGRGWRWEQNRLFGSRCSRR